MLRLSARSSLSSSRSSSILMNNKTRAFKSSSPTSSTTETPPPGYAIDPTAGPMLRFQASLPRLPVPSLSSTLSKYLETVQPHLSPSAFTHTQSLVKQFLASPQSSELQKRLEARAADPNTKNWLSEWWNETAYMGYRDPVVVFVSYFFVHVDDKLRKDPAKRAASLIKAMLAFRHMVESKTLEPERVKSTPLCMDSYKWLFHSSRYPVKPSDTAHKFDPATHNHIVFIRKNKFYLVPLTTTSNLELSAAQLEVQIEKIISMAGDHPSETPIGVLTSDNRDNWAENREKLINASPSGLNKRSLEAIESSMIVVCLDDKKPVTREEISWQTWVGDGRNRFYDKHQLIVYDNGRSGFLGEHSCMDGTPTLRMNEFMLASLAKNKIDLGWARSTETGADETELPPPIQLQFDINDEIRQAITSAESRFDTLVGAHELSVLHYEGYGKNLIKKFKASPDAWVQLVKQLAFWKLEGRPAVTYESAQTRKFVLGRTEVIRSASNESRRWVESMGDLNESDTTRASLFRKAITRHLQYASWAADGQGVDRHLFGLKKCLKEGEEVPGIYKDEAFGKTSHWEFSTSQLSSPFVDGWGYGEVVPDGYGLSYAIGDDYIRWTITGVKGKRDTKVLRHYLAEAATETRAMMERAVVEESRHAKL